MTAFVSTFFRLTLSLATALSAPSIVYAAESRYRPYAERVPGVQVGRGEGPVVFEGKIDPVTGRESVVQLQEGGVNSANLRRGTFSPDGKIEWNSTQRFNAGGLGPIDNGAPAEFKPSQIGKIASVREYARNVGPELRKLLKGENNIFERGATKLDRGAKAIGRGMKTTAIELPRGAGIFFVVLGLASAVNLMVNYPTSPAAWEEFIRQLSDPRAVPILASFMGASMGAFFAARKFALKVGGPAALSKPGYGATVSIAPLIAGVLVATGVSEFMSDPNFLKCTGFESYSKVLQFKWDWNACDALYDTWTTNERWMALALDKAVPIFFDALVAGGLIQLVRYGAPRLFSKVGATAALRSIRFKITPKGGPLVSALTAAGTAILTVSVYFGAFYVANQWVGLGEWMRDYAKLYYGGVNPIESRRRILTEWERLKRTSFYYTENKDTSGLAPDYVDLETELYKFGSLMQGWRYDHFSRVNDAVSQWSTKTENYFATSSMAFDFYKDALERMEFDRGAANDDVRATGGFNQGFVDGHAELQKAIEGGAWVKLHPQDWWRKQWKYVRPANFSEFLLISMACGPEAEGYGQSPSPSWWGTVKGYASSAQCFVTEDGCNGTPDKMITDVDGWTTNFFPPRITSAYGDGKRTVCQDVSLMTMRQTPLSVFPIQKDGVNYDNLYKYILADVRPIIYENEDGFPGWWSQNVVPTAAEFEVYQRAEYEKMLAAEYLPALLNPKYKICEPEIADRMGKNIPNADVRRYLRAFSLGGEPCPADANNRLAYGALWSLMDEFRFYLALRTDLLTTHKGRFGLADEKAVLDDASALMQVLMPFINGTTDISSDKFVETKAAAQEAATLLNAQLSLHESQYEPGVLPPGMRDPIKSYLSTLNSRLRAVTNQVVQYYEILAAVHR